MIICDLQQTMIANLSVQLGNHQNAQLDESMLRHMILNQLRSFRMKFKDYGEMVIATDTRASWRKKVFPYYKWKRHENRKESELDWDTIFKSFNVVKEELKEFFPWRVIDVDGAEADDIIGVLCHHFGDDNDSPIIPTFQKKEPILILSGDHDFKQLQKFNNVGQFDPRQKKKVLCDKPAQYLKEHIIRGDAGDGIPNILSGDDVFVTNARQKPIYDAKLQDWLKKPVDQCVEEQHFSLRNWKRNEELVDLSFTPQAIRDQVLLQYESQAGKGRQQLPNYFIKKRLKHLHESINEFF
jgi:hypothetical protein